MRRTLPSVLAIALLALGGCVGWGSAALPPPLTDDEQAFLSAHRDDLRHVTVGVQPYEFPAYSNRLVEALRDADLFARVALVADLGNPPDVVARVNRRVHGTATIPLWTLLTFGIVPTSCDEEWGESFVFARPGHPDVQVHVEYAYTGRSTLGWVALLEAPLPDRTVLPFSPRSSNRLHQHIASSVLAVWPELRSSR